MLITKLPTSKKYPVVISVPHAGTHFPDEVQKTLCSNDPLLLTRDSDLFVDELYQSAPDLGICMVVYPYCRYVIDPNRDPKKLDASFVTGAPKVENPHFIGLVSHKTTLGEPLLTKPIHPNDLQNRVNNYYQPFHDKLKELIENTQKEFGFCIHIDAHSMPSKAAKGHHDTGERADIVPGNLYGKSCSDKLTKIIVDHFQSNGLSVNPNNPYQGGFITQHYGAPNQNTHTIQIEINRKTYMNETTHKKLPDAFENLQNIIQKLMVQVKTLNLLQS